MQALMTVTMLTGNRGGGASRAFRFVFLLQRGCGSVLSCGHKSSYALNGWRVLGNTSARNVARPMNKNTE